MFSRLFVFAALVSLALSKPHPRSKTVLEARQGAPTSYVRTGPADGNTELQLRIALTQSNTEGLIDALYAVSTPSSSTYGEHLTKEEVEKFVAPSADTVEAVNNWLKEAGLTAQAITPAGDWLSIVVPVSKANELFDADFNVFTHTEGTQAIRTLSYSIPTELVGHVELVHPTISFPSPQADPPVTQAHRGGSTGSGLVSSTCSSSGITPACVQALYGIPTTPATSSSNGLGVTGYSNEYANEADLASFLTTYRPDMSSTTTFALQTLDNGTNSQILSQAGEEADIDIQYTVGLATNVPVTFISVGSHQQDDGLNGFLDTINFLLGESTPPQVLTTSYGWYELQTPELLANNLCTAYAQLGARGVSILFGSGSGGAGGQSQGCAGSLFVPAFPSGCPFITSVGATEFSDSTVSEEAAAFSAGGFSNYWDAPSYQTTAVSSYLNIIGNTYSGFSASGRGFPDVAAIGTNVEIIWKGLSRTISASSPTSPIFASIVALLNDELIAAGKSPLGFLNPFLYANPSAFTDITSGTQYGCDDGSDYGYTGFPAATGWDPLTGLGTPNYAALKTAAGL